jgi:hypothetical protein
VPRPPMEHPALALLALLGTAEGGPGAPDDRAEPGARAEPHLVSALEEVLTASRTGRVEIGALRSAAVTRDASMASGGRSRLGLALAALSAAGRLRLPQTLSAWDDGPRPRLPTWVQRIGETSSTHATERADRTVPAELLALLPEESSRRLAGLERGLSPEEARWLTAVGRWLRADGARRPVVPSRERSLELFGDEKRLDSVMRSRLFTSGILTMELLRAEAVPPPLLTTWVPGRRAGEVLCVVAENHHTWASLLGAARAAADRHAGIHVGYGAGNQFAVSLPTIARLEPVVPAITYFGDLDERGLRIPGAAAIAATVAGLPPIRPALGLYHRLLASGVRRATESPLDEVTARSRAAWLGPELGPIAAALLVSGVRIPQESVGTDALRGTAPDDWV